MGSIFDEKSSHLGYSVSVTCPLFVTKEFHSQLEFVCDVAEGEEGKALKGEVKESVDVGLLISYIHLCMN